MADKTQLNENQQTAVDFEHTKPAVVTAAAGSGKTTLLVERVIRLLTSSELNIRADRLAIMTFTRNATKSLIEKLNRALNEKLVELSEDSEKRTEREWLAEQIFALRQASISTIDAFCLKIIKENPEVFNLPINFTIADAAKKTAMQTAAIRGAMQDFYDDSADCPFSSQERDALFFTFDFESDDKLRSAVIDTAEELSSYANADEWLDGAVASCENPKILEAQYIRILKPKTDFLVRRLGEFFALYDGIPEGLHEDADSAKKGTALDMFNNEIIPYIENHIEYDRGRLELVEERYAEFSKNPCLDTLSDLVTGLRDFDSAPKRADLRRGTRSGFKTLFTTARNNFQDAVDKLIGLSVNKEFERRSHSQQLLVANAFVKLVRSYRGCYDAIKMSNGCLEFSDCELLLLRKLDDEEFRKQLAGRFECVIVDEFQDSNDIQAEIFRKIGGGNLFYVGDVKQSIYAFRGGNPDIMARLCEGKDGFSALPLNRNYRSRAAVIDTVNAAFSELMTAEYGGVNYADKDNRLVFGAEYFPDIPQEHKPKYDCEVHLLNQSKDSDEKDMAAARYAARRIKELHDDPDFLVTNKNGERVRAKYSDFVILMRNNGKIPLYRAALRELGIDSSAPSGGSLLDSEEIVLVLNYLRIVDNPLRDEELLKVLMSPIYRFTAEETARLRLGVLGIDTEKLPENSADKIARKMKKYSLYNCVRLCTEPLTLGDYIEGEDFRTEREISRKLIRFSEDLKRFRQLMTTSSVYNLIKRIYEDTDLISVAAAFEDSASRVANIRRLLELAADFEERDGGSLSDFLRFLERASSNLSHARESAAIADEKPNSVSIMTFHASKGLEAPVCILAELQNQMNKDDYTDTLLCSRECFFALQFTDFKKRVKQPTLAHAALKELIRKKQCGEELRLLYVAMTRAREKLIMMGKISIKSAFEDVFNPSMAQETFSGNIPFKWILSSLARYYNTESENFGELPVSLTVNEITGAAPEAVTESALYADISADEAESLARIITREYAYPADTKQQSKLTVTELAHMNDVKPVTLTAPSFVTRQATGAEKGNAYHHFMEFFPIEEIRRADCAEYAEIVERALDEMTKSRLITERERDIIQVRNIVNFFTGELGARMLKSPCIRREEPFYAEVNGTLLGLDYNGDLPVQGRIDLYFVEDGELVVVDYKSDNVKNLEEEKESYARQIKIYGQILPKLKGMSVRAIYLYAFLKGEAIEIQ